MLSFNRHLDNCISNVRMLLPLKGEMAMAKHRLRVCVGHNDDGSPIVKRISGDTELELADNVVKAILCSERRLEFVKQEERPHPILTFKAYAEEWLTTYKKKHIKATTLGGYNTILEYHLYPVFGNTDIAAITTKSIQEMLNGKADKSRKTLQDIIILFRSILESARKDGLIPVNPADDRRITLPSTKKTVRNALEVEAVKDIISNIGLLSDEDDRRYQALLIFTGMRRGEVLGLKWEDVDLAVGVIHVQRNVTFPRGRNEPLIGTTKTDSGVRDVPILPMLLDYLKPLGVTGYIVGNGEKPNTLSVVRRRGERINRLIDTHGATPHIFRHSFATMLYDAGTDIKTIQSIMGQTDYKTTADRYCHPREDRKRTAANAVNSMLST